MGRALGLKHCLIALPHRHRLFRAKSRNKSQALREVQGIVLHWKTDFGELSLTAPIADVLWMLHHRLMTEVGFDALMTEACAGWGLCGCIKEGEPLHVTTLIPSHGPVTADQFVEWLLLADNLNPNLERWNRHKEALRAAFVTHMGAEIIDAGLLRWSDAPPPSDKPDLKFRGRISSAS